MLEGGENARCQLAAEEAPPGEALAHPARSDVIDGLFPRLLRHDPCPQTASINLMLTTTGKN